jgi:CheY-like chemotaxis protein
MLVAEDREEDIDILKLAFQRAKVTLPLRFVENGEEVVEYLKGAGRFSDRNAHPLPKLLLLDLQMPKRDGFEVLEWLRSEPGLRRLLVVVFTSSGLAQDVNRAFDLGANSYLVKPTDFHELQVIARHLEGYWLKLNQFPDCSVGAAMAGVLMRVLLRDTKELQYFAGGNRWTDDPRQAVSFERSERAVQAALGMNLRRFEVVIEAEERILAPPARLVQRLTL